MNNNENVIRSLLRVKLSISAWLGQQRVAGLEDELEQNKGAESGSSVVKLKVIPKEYFNRITQSMSQLRTFWDANSLPWEDGGWRVVPTSQYHRLLTQTQVLKENFEASVKNLTDNYDACLTLAKTKLNGLFDEKLYPSKDDIAGRYEVRIYTTVIPMAQDVRVTGLTEEQVAETKRNIENQCNEQVKLARVNVVERLKELTEDIVDRMNQPAKGTKYECLLKKVEKTGDALSRLNLEADPILDNLIKDVREIGKRDRDEIAASETVRSEIATKAKEILEKIAAL